MRKEEMAFILGFRVDIDGDAFTPDGKLIKPYKNSTKNDVNKKYYCFNIRYEKKNYIINTHRLVAYQKFGDKLFEEGIVVRHFDGITTNNQIDNIGIGTQSDNQLDIPKSIRLERSMIANEGRRIIKRMREESFYSRSLFDYANKKINEKKLD